MATYNAEKNYTGPTITVRQIRSAIGNKPKNRGTLRALGLRKIGDTNTLPDRPEIRGMLARVPHLIEVTEGTPEKGSN
jgi:large subunit ribosomal protein L30